MGDGFAAWAPRMKRGGWEEKDVCRVMVAVGREGDLAGVEEWCKTRGDVDAVKPGEAADPVEGKAAAYWVTRAVCRGKDLRRWLQWRCR